jgi:hypothetical protein
MMTRTASRRDRVRGAVISATLAVVTGLALTAFAGASANAVTPSTSAPAGTGGACHDGSGVTVVVDFTDLGGQVEASCAASGYATGRGALLAAGLTPTDSKPGLICAIDRMPDPCPESFQGSFWSYWHAAPGGAWVSYQVGADASHPTAGTLEGWRYNDGSTGPSVAPAAVSATAAVAPSAATPSAHPAPVEAAAVPAGEALTIGLGALLLAIVGVAVVLVTRRSSQRAE